MFDVIQNLLWAVKWSTVTMQLKGGNFPVILGLKGEKFFGFNSVMLLVKHSAQGVSYEIPSPAEDEESTNAATTQPLPVPCETKPLRLCQEDGVSVQNSLK